MEMFKPSQADKQLLSFLANHYEEYIERITTQIGFLQSKIIFSGTAKELAENRINALKEVDTLILHTNALNVAKSLLLDFDLSISENIAYACISDAAFVLVVYAPEHLRKTLESIIEANNKERAPKQKVKPEAKKSSFTVGKSFDFFTSTKS